MNEPFEIDDEKAIKQFFQHNKLQFHQDSFVYQYNGGTWFIPKDTLLGRNCLHIFENIYRLQKLKLLDKNG
jgi:hypothetical protein